MNDARERLEARGVGEMLAALEVHEQAGREWLLVRTADLRTVLDALSDEVTDAMIEAAAREIEPELGCWKPNAGKDWDWRKRQEMNHAERILRAALLERGRSK